MNSLELNNTQKEASEIAANLREATVEFNTQSRRYRLEIEELKITISKLKKLNDMAHKRICKFEQENEELNEVISELYTKLDNNNMTINNLIIKNNEMKEINEECKQKLEEEEKKCERLAVKPSEEVLINTIKEQKEEYEEKVNDIQNSRDYYKNEFDVLMKNFALVTEEYLESKEKISILTDEINELKEREDIMKMEIGSLKLRLSNKNQKPLCGRINDDPELKKYLDTQQMMLEHLETENDSMHEMYQLMFRKIKEQLGKNKDNGDEKIYDHNIFRMDEEKKVIFNNNACNANASSSNIFITSCKNCSGKIEIA